MSTRNIRKFVGGNMLPPPDEDATYEPLYAKPSDSNVKNKYQGLCPQSESESEPEAVENEKESEEESIKITPSQRRRNKNKKRKQKKQASKMQMDEIDKSLQEVNKLLGAPPPAPVVAPEPKQNIEETLFGISIKHLNPAAELKRLLGPDLEEEARKRRAGRNQHHYVRRGLVVPLEEDELMRFKRVGISMSMVSPRRADGYNYFRIDHDTGYQQHVRMFLRNALSHKEDFPEIVPNDVIANFHAEEMLQLVDIYFAVEEYERTKKILESLVAYLQFISHPLFRITERTNRLEYRVLENRLYHVTMLKYAYVMTNSACHRTALEIIKVLLNLDPSDPLALIILVDMLALRAREHQWLIDLVEYWKIHRDADYMFNLLYSSALSHFHVIRKQKGDMSIADERLQYAMKRFPNVVLHLLKVTNNKNQQIETCDMFQENQQMPKVLQDLWTDLLKYYTMFTASKWREPEVWTWFLRNALDMVEKYNNDPAVRKYVEDFAVHRGSMRCLPHQIIRHLQVIKFMNNFVFDEQVYAVRAGVAAYNPEPFPAETINRYGYKFSRNPVPQATRRANLLGDFVRSIAPDFNVQNNAAADADDDAARDQVPPAAPHQDQPPRPPHNGPRGPQGEHTEMADIVNTICRLILSGGGLQDVIIESNEPTPNSERPSSTDQSNPNNDAVQPNCREQSNPNVSIQSNNTEQSNPNNVGTQPNNREQSTDSGSFPNGIPGPDDAFWHADRWDFVCPCITDDDDDMLYELYDSTDTE